MASSLQKSILVGGSFQDCSGSPLSSGYLLFTLNHDSTVTVFGSPQGSQIMAGVSTKFYLDMYGSLAPNSGIWTNDNLFPSGSYYTVQAFSNIGLEVWSSPQVFVLKYSPAINVGSLTPVNP